LSALEATNNRISWGVVGSGERGYVLFSWLMLFCERLLY
jgi:hypothetical protein